MQISLVVVTAIFCSELFHYVDVNTSCTVLCE